MKHKFILLSILLLFIGIYTYLVSWQLTASNEQAREGINAFLMTQEGNFTEPLYYTFNSENFEKGYITTQKDQWQTNFLFPIWAKTLSFKLFGINDFSLWLPEMVALLLLFFFLFQWISLYQKIDFSFFTSLIAFSTPALTEGSTSIWGMAWSMAAVYFFAQTVDFLKRTTAPLAGFCLGLAFLSFGWAAVAVVVALFFYLLFQKNLFHSLTQSWFWIWLVSTLTLPAFWWGQTGFIAPTLEPDFLFQNLENAYGYWLYALPATLLLGVLAYQTYQSHQRTATHFTPRLQAVRGQSPVPFQGVDKIIEPFLPPNGQLLMMAALLWLLTATGAVFLSFSWAISWGFVAVLLAAAIYYLNQKIRFFNLFFLVGLLLMLGFKFYQTWSMQPPLSAIQTKKATLTTFPKVFWYGELPEEAVLFDVLTVLPDLTFVESGKPIPHQQDAELVGLKRSVYQSDFNRFKNYQVLAQDKNCIFLKAIFY